MYRKWQVAVLQGLIIIMVVIGLMINPVPALAALSITGVQPDHVSNAVLVELVVTGTDFEDGARVVVEHVGALVTSFVSTSVLSAVLPPGLPPGVYTITVVNPDSTSVSLQGGLTITGPDIPPEPTSTPGASPNRPVIVVVTYGTGMESVPVGEPATLTVDLRNKGQEMAFNVKLSFTPGDFIPLQTGGLVTANEIDPGETRKLKQPFTLSSEAMYKRFVTVVATATYSDINGASYSDSFSLSIPVKPPAYGASTTATPTPTVTSVPNLRPQLIINSYTTDPLQLQPGFEFFLRLTVENVGKSTAQRVSMILGGGSSSGGNAGQGTPDAGGVSGGSSSLSNFSPLASSNVQFLGDIEVGAALEVQALLIVNTTTLPGAYSLPISFTYIGPNGGNFTDDQVVTLLVYSPPKVEVNFYRDPGPIFVGQTNILPIQVVNLGRVAVVLGNMTVSVVDGFLENNTALVGPLDPGGYFTLDSLLTPNQPGPMEVFIEIGYTDDFNQPNVLTDTIQLDVQEMPVIEPLPGEEGSEGLPPVQEPQPETFWQKVLRFFRGLFGLDSGQPTLEPVPGQEVPTEEVPPGGTQPGSVIIRPGPKG